MYRKFATALSVLVLLLNLPLVSAKAAEQCLAEFQDTVWSNGEPQEVKAKLNYNLVGKKSSNTNQSMFSNLKYGDIEFTTIYEYSGTNCATRTVKITKKNSDNLPVYYSNDELKSYLKTMARNFEEENRNIAALDSLTNFLADFSWTLNVEGSIMRTDSTFNIIKDEQFGKLRVEYNKILSIPYFNRYTPIIQADEGCRLIPTSIDTRIDPPNLTTFKALPTFGVFIVGIQFDKKLNCKLSLLYGSTTAMLLPGAGYPVPEKVGFFKVGEFAVIPKLINKSLNSTILCSKGKLTKKITGKNPKCPTGYKKAS